MKRLRILIIAALLLLSARAMGANGGFGIIGGATFSQTSLKELNPKNPANFHVGMTYQAMLGLGFSLQPSLIYNVREFQVPMDGGTPVQLGPGFIELPVAIQWGLDLLLLRPFVELAPYVGYAVNSYKNEGAELINRFQYGAGVGGGIEVWKFQISCRYNWNFSNLFRTDSYSDAKLQYRGVNLSFAFIF